MRRVTLSLFSLTANKRIEKVSESYLFLLLWLCERRFSFSRLYQPITLVEEIEPVYCLLFSNIFWQTIRPGSSLSKDVIGWMSRLSYSLLSPSLSLMLKDLRLEIER